MEQNEFKYSVISGLFVTAFAALMWTVPIAEGCILSDPPEARSSDPTQVAFPPERLAKLEQVKRVLSLIDAENYSVARDAAQGLIDSAVIEFDQIEAYRMMSMVLRRSGEPNAARDVLLIAEGVWNNSANLKRQAPFLYANVLLDRASLAAFEFDNAKEAIELYDRLQLETGPTTLSQRRAAAQNATVLTAKLGRFADAIDRSDRLLSGELGQAFSVPEMIHWKLAQATWFNQSGDFDGASEHYRLVWDTYKDRFEADILTAGIQVARVTTIGPACDLRVARAHELKAKIDAIRSATPPLAEAPSGSELNDLEWEVMVIIADSESCPGMADEAAAARVRMTELHPDW